MPVTSSSADIVDVTTIGRIAHGEAMEIAAVENAKFAAALASLTPTQWATQTECERWDVRAMAAHVIGAAAAQVSPREFVRQVRRGKPVVVEIGAEFWWDGMNEVQVRERATASADELRVEWATTSVKALRARAKLPRPIAGLPLLKLPVVGRQKLSYLFDLGFTRDVWMHRIDIAFAIGEDPDLDAAHDGRLLADLVAEWATTHGEPFTLEIDGPAGGTFTSGTDGERVRIGAVDFCRTLSGRATGDGILRHPLPL